ncbi:MAG TPA: AAA family ATPase [Isosphaeraceae bacterium]|nr:AAA family ATPase [Isosphaeraceae bacterium]
MTRELARVIIGQNDVLKQILIALFCQGHCILEGVPGLAKTLLVSKLSETMSLKFSRIQFTPDLMPMDITGPTSCRRAGQGGSASFSSCTARFSPTSCWPTKSTGRPPRRRRRCSKPCRNIR